MKRSSWLRNDTSWLLGLLVYSISCIVMFLLSLGVFATDMAFLSESKNGATTALNFKYDSIAYPITLVLTVFELVSVIYFVWNYVLWCISYSKSGGKRKSFNFIAIVVGGIIVLAILADTLLKLTGVFARLPEWMNSYYGQNPIVVGNGYWTTTILKPYLLLVASLAGAIFFGIMYFLQRLWFKTEENENARNDVQNHYRKLEINKKRSLIKKQKQKDLSKKIRVF